MERIFEGQTLTVDVEPGQGAEGANRTWVTFTPVGATVPFGRPLVQKRGETGIYFFPMQDHWYQTPEIWPAINAALPFLRGEVLTYGSSMGGFAALAFARDFGADRVIAAAPQVSISQDIVPFDRRWAHKSVTFERDDARKGISGRVTLIYDPLHREDRLNAAMIPADERIVFPMAGHNVLHVLSSVKELSRFISAIADQDAPAIIASRQRTRQQMKGNFIHFFSMGEWFKERGRYAKAVPYYGRCLMDHPWFHPSYHGLADCLWALGKHDAAIEADRKAIEVMPTIGEHWIRCGIRLIERGRGAEALDLFVRAIAAHPNVAEMYNGHSIALRHLERRAESILSLRMALELMPNNEAWQVDLSGLESTI